MSDGRICAECLRPIDRPSYCQRPHAGGASRWRPHPRVRPAGCDCTEGAQILVWHWCGAEGSDGHSRGLRCEAVQLCA